MTIALDTETFLIYPGNLAPELVCVSWATSKDSGLFHHADSGLETYLTEMFRKFSVVFANAPFDLAVIMAKWPHLIPIIFKALDEGRIHDIQTREKLLDITRGTFRFEEDEDGNVKQKGYSLYDLTARRLGERLDKDTWRMRYHDLYDTPLEEWPEGARHYAVTDAIVTLKIFEGQDKVKQYLTGEAAQVRAHTMLHLSACHGFMTNKAAVLELEARVIEGIDKVRDDLIEAGLVRKDGTRDTKAAIRRMVSTETLFFTTAGQKLLDAGMPLAEFDALVLEKGKYISVAEEPCTMSGDKVLMAYSQYSKLQSLLTGTIKDMKTGCVIPIQTRYEVLMATGRTSSSGPNIQNLRRAPGVRECFVPREGHVIVACDYAAAELHTLAQVCYDWLGRSKLGDAMNDGIDVHTWLGSKLQHKSYEDMDLTDEVDAAARQVAKAGNFGFPGGCSVRRFTSFAAQYGCDINEKQGSQIKNLWMLSWSEMDDYFRYIRECGIGGNLFTVKIPRIDFIRGKCTYTAACNLPFQGLAAAGAKAAGYEITRRQFCEPKSELYGTRILAFVHDEYLIEAPVERGHEVAMEMSQVMETKMNELVPDCPTTAEPTIMTRWSKKAKPTFENGRLVAWA